METYSALRAFADSWMLLAMTLFFVGVLVWAFRPGSRQAHADSANLIFRNDDRPAGAGQATRGAPSKEGRP
ncbi:MAG: cbb3-type cytochrome c oxidase subunit 3 [Rhodobacteraceae bacterium]|jgi:cytochrome c oxidase cbb3-type subunit 4|nr:cbb3-type cytochrome c oxidase subunit 3 [Paracoccaceae bacterium]